MSRELTLAAVDLGASSGRVMTARVGPGRLDLTEVHRFPNRPVRTAGTLQWDVLSLYAGVLDGLRAAGRGTDGDVAGIGVDSWAVDVGLLDADGALLGNPVHYRDARHGTAVPAVHAAVPPDELYRVNGLQHLPFTTVYQLAAMRGTARFAAARQALLVPDLLAYWLTGARVAEVTNASTTGLLDATTRQWATGLLDRLELPRDLLPGLVQPGAEVGRLTAEVRAETGLGGVPVIAVGSHDTASAVVGVPASSDRFAYVSCGTWSLVGVELERPVLTEAGRAAGFTNELGVDGTVRYLHNVMGLWLLQESLRTWAAAGLPADLPDLLAAAEQVPAFTAVVDVDDPRFLPPGDVPGRIAQACAETGQPPPRGPAGTVRCILDGLALAYRRTVRRAQELSGREVDVVHLVGGGARNALLCRLTADACGLPVLAGPVEAAALGNALVQARALGAVDGGLGEMRRLLRSTQALVGYRPAGSSAAWDAAEERLPRGR